MRHVKIVLPCTNEGAWLRITVENPRDPDSADSKGAGIGTRNVRRRLAALYGSEADMDLASAAESFRVELRLPCSD